MVGEECPGLEFPPSFERGPESDFLEEAQFVVGVEEVLFVMSSGGDDVGAGMVDMFAWSVRPAHDWVALPSVWKPTQVKARIASRTPNLVVAF